MKNLKLTSLSRSDVALVAPHRISVGGTRGVTLAVMSNKILNCKRASARDKHIQHHSQAARCMMTKDIFCVSVLHDVIAVFLQL